MRKVAVINVVGLTRSLIGPSTPNIDAFLESGWSCPLEEQFPAVTCTAQAAMLTGKQPRDHGIVGNGWYFDDLAEVGFWKQHNGLIQSETVYDTLKRKHPGFTLAKVFWWFNMHSSADWSVTPRPHYPADGRKVFDVHSCPMEMSAELKEDLGPFPFHEFWGPAAGFGSSRWIAESAAWIFDRYRADLSLVYLPHLDYPLQRIGPDPERLQADLKQIDDLLGELIRYYEQQGVTVILLSEYGITEVTRHLHPNRILREAGFLQVRPSLTWELLDCGGSEAFAVSDHQICHVYVKNPQRIPEVVQLFEKAPGTRRVLFGDAIREAGLDHRRSGNVILMAESDCWYTYYFWNDDDRAPDFARCVDIHRKPGYDPVELFIDPDLKFPKLKIAWTLLRKQLGFRYSMDVIPLTPELARGSHGTPVADPERGPLVISRLDEARPETDSLPITAIRDLILAHFES